MLEGFDMAQPTEGAAGQFAEAEGADDLLAAPEPIRNSRAMARASETRRAVRSRPPRWGRSVGVALVAAAAIAGLFYWWLARDTAERAAPSSERLPVAEHPVPAPAPPPEAVQAIPLPPLDASDAFLREQVGALSSHADLARWLAEGDLASRFVASVDNVAEGKSPRVHLHFLRPSEPFRVLGAGTRARVDPASYTRYDVIADVVASLDAGTCVALYRRIAPLLQEAYVALGYPDRSFETRARAAIDELLAAPVLEESPVLLAHIGRYQWADPAIEQLSDARKQLLRMGPRNVERIQSKLTEIRAAFDAGAP